ncbi:NAD(P)H-dependent oxidoreductase [Alkaliphilus transvaalensis]|uniref:NAD(P)H-dependent oxidoreductase n=1 Tax=Alkaliphilus transvaalensis TaxID=114628 RepID=UPI00146FC50E|nr:NAD(P)H-dependent oxidoreductase [Alkaliphilus transvaalensis]
MKDKKALLLIGSPKIKNSTSEALGNYLLNRLKKGYIIETLQIKKSLKDDLGVLLEKINNCDLLIISSPLYVDCLPAPVIKIFEEIADYREEKNLTKKQSLMAIINCGFPEYFHNNIALKICRNFAERNGFHWLGGLTMGCGVAINGKPIDQLGGMTRNITKALDLASEAIVEGGVVPVESIELMRKQMFPKWLYVMAGHRGWKSQAKKFNVNNLYARPYAE